MRKPISVLAFIFILIAAFVLASCEIKQKTTSESDKKVSQQTEKMMVESNKAVGMPNITNWQEKKLLKELYELRDKEELLTYTYIVDMNGRKLFLGRSIGYGLPASVQFSNPDKLVDVTDYGIDSYQANDAAVVGQPEPNGLFMPDNLTATWVFLLDDKGDPRPTYIEPLIIVSPFPLH